jgi:hypothetical protein
MTAAAPDRLAPADNFLDPVAERNHESGVKRWPSKRATQKPGKDGPIDSQGAT